MIIDHSMKTEREGERTMANMVDLTELDSKDAKLVEKLVESLREKAKRKKAKMAAEAVQEEDILAETFGGWADALDCEAFKRAIYEGRITGTRPEASS